MNVYYFYLWVMCKVEFEVMWVVNNEKYVVNGFVYFGKYYDIFSDYGKGVLINEGFWVRIVGLSVRNDIIFLGRGLDDVMGILNINYFIINIFGVIIDLEFFFYDEIYVVCVIKFLFVEDGICIYDSISGIFIIYVIFVLVFVLEILMNKVVIDCFDLWVFKGGLCEINEVDFSVYKYGLK